VEKYRSTIKFIVRGIVGTSVGFVAKDVIQNNVRPEKTRQKAEAYVGGLIAYGMAAEQAKNWVDPKVDVVLNRIDRIHRSFK